MDQELATKMAAEVFVMPELDPNAANAAQAEGGKEGVIERVVGVCFHFLTMWRCDGVSGPAHCWSYGWIENNKYNDLIQ